jgi:hypothetical protein
MVTGIQKNRLVKITLGIVVSYCLAFIVLSSWCTYSNVFDMDGYFFVSPTSDRGETAHKVCCIVFWPLIEIDSRLLTGRRPAALPLRALSSSQTDLERAAEN